MRKIKCTLGTIDKAISELKAYQRELEVKYKRFMQALIDRGVEIAKEEAPYDTGELSESIGGRIDGNKAYIFTDNPYAFFVECGFGIPGANSPHPTVSISYNIKGREVGGSWFYWDQRTGNAGWSHGQPANPFMYRTALRLSEEVPKIAREVFG